MTFAALGLALLAVLVWLGRQPSRALPFSRPRLLRVVRAIIAVLAAVGAVAMGVRGSWIFSLVLVGLSIWLGGSVRRTNNDENEQMSAAAARSMLGVGPEASRAEVDAAYRRLIGGFILTRAAPQAWRRS